MNGERESLAAVFAKFAAFEQSHLSLYLCEVSGVRFWHLIRFLVFNNEILPCFTPMGQAHPDVQMKRQAFNRSSWGTRIKQFLRSLRLRISDCLLHNPDFAIRKRKVLFSLIPRVTRLADGRAVRIVLDFFLRNLRSSFAVLERGDAVVHGGIGRVFRPHPVQRALRRFRRSSAAVRVAEESGLAAARLAQEISNAFGIAVDADKIARRIESAVSFELSAKPVFCRWLRRLGVQCVVTVVHYGTPNMVLTRAAREMGIPVAELQHGTIVPAHAAYNLPTADSPYSPDYLLAWGDFWAEQARNFPAKAAIAVGYPYLEQFLAETEDHTSPRRSRCVVLYVSQGTVGNELAASAAGIRKRLPEEGFSIKFKLHPNEVKSWRTLYPELEGSGVEVIDDPLRSIYSLYDDTDVSVGAYSTALIEGFMWGVPAYVLRPLYGADIMEPFRSTGLLRYVRDTDELAERLLGGEWKSVRLNGCRESLWRKGAADAIARTIDKIAETGGIE